MVSAIITTHNRSILLKRAIESVLNQTFRDIECIVVDDKSTDNTKDVCKEYPTVKYIYIPPEESKGGNYARNIGIKTSKGKYCAFLDDDDYWLPNKIEKQVELIEEKGCELVYCGKKMERVLSGSTTYYNSLPNPAFYGDMKKKILLTICCCTTSTIMISKEALYEVGLFDENLAFWQDYELTIRMAQRTPFYYNNEPLCVYRVNPADNQRLTNKYFGWKKAVDYIHKKHHILYSKLSIKERVYVHYLVWNDAYYNRCKPAGLIWRAYYYRLLIIFFYSLPRRIAKLLRRIN